MRVLVAEDNRDLAAFLQRSLSEEGFSVDVSNDGEDALHRIKGEPFDIAILDWMIPRLSGLQVIKTARAAGVSTPILMLTAKDTVADVVQGLNSGADDYITKPFKFEILLARVHAISRRNSAQRSTVLHFAGISLDLITHKAVRDGKELSLLPKEEALLAYFLRHPRRPLTRTMLYEHVWNDAYDGISNTLEVHIKELRRKLEAFGGPRVLQTLRGRGYILDDEENIQD